MNFFRHRPRLATGLPALALLLAVPGCSSADDTAHAAVPTPDTKVTDLCRNLHKRLPDTVDGHGRNDPSPRSELTAGWGDPAIILRCGVERPALMDDPKALPVKVNGVGWAYEKRDDGTQVLTTTLRVAYVEVTLPKELAAEGASPLVDFAGPVKKAIPEGIAD
ncbi:DUF3515 domain-containing protein [Streptomyces sp. NPDC058686]|uniref:DUF3515 domain-containing protein n=1 Tax=Streptomyces sp. NPDC058686 TaxID=3346599 RepID=UPI0036531123